MSLLERRRMMLGAAGGGRVDYSKKYLTLEMLEAGTQTFSIATNLSTTNCTSVSYSLDNGATWTSTQNIDSTLIEITTPSLAVGDKVLWKGTATTYATDVAVDTAKNSLFVMDTTKFKVYGNIASMLYGDDDFATKTTMSGQRNFARFFNGCTGLTDAENLILPFTTVTWYSFYGTFSGCTSLKTVPSLPATTVGRQSYQYIFNGCTGIVSVPSGMLPATTINVGCYQGMFNGCTALTNAPNISATKMSESSCEGMFSGCTSLTIAPQLPATTMGSRCYRSMFSGCTSLATAPILPALTLSATCYAYMFNGCTSLNYIKMLATDVSASSCMTDWVKNVASSGTFVKNADATWTTTGNSGVPSGWTVETANS